MARRRQDLQSIRSEGGLLPPDLLTRVLDSNSDLDGIQPGDYGLAKNERLNEIITQSWNRLQNHWEDFREAAANLPESEAGMGLTNEKWNLPLLRELGFGMLPTTAGPEIGSRTYPISRFLGPVPIHLVGCGLSLDRRAKGQRGAAMLNPHGLVQEYLNRSDDHLWAVVSNGLQFRILRDNQALSRQSFLEFDLEAMFDGKVFSDFVLLWLVGHATRFMPPEGQRPEACWLEQWTQEAEEQGTRALGDLRIGVENALQILGEGFTSHPKNSSLRDQLRSGELSLNEFHGQLLRVVYRLIFLFVAEDRTLEGQSLLHPPDDSEAAQQARGRYSSYYSGVRVRDMAGQIKGSRHGDLWRQHQVVVHALSGHENATSIREQLALPALGSFLWDPASTQALNVAELTNFDLLEALRHLAFTRQGKVLRPVDYKNLGAEELGGVYESLLALTPQVSADGARFSFAEFAGSERKTSGSYYTPDSLVQCLLDSALDPVVEDAIKGKSPAEAEKAILALKVCDPAVGSGHFLVGAAHRLARHLARVRALAEGESEPSPMLYQHALRDVIGRCLYGVDINPMAAELCRVGLWLEALEPGKPLSFLDHHIRVGNSLLGTTPALIADGLPDDAFTPIEGDDKKICSSLKKRNKVEREGGQLGLELPKVAEARADYEMLASRGQGVDQAPDDSLEAVSRKAQQFSKLVVSPEYRHQQKIADAWCAAFVWRKRSDAPEPITTESIRRLEVEGGGLDPTQHCELKRLTSQYQFFHWYLAFPHVFARGGFDVVLGNPPWEKINLKDSEFFAISHPEIANAPNKAKRKKLLDVLRNEEPEAYNLYEKAVDQQNRTSVFFRLSGGYPLTGVSRINLYSVFCELALRILGYRGRVGLVLASGIATDDNNKALFSDLVAGRRIVHVWDFDNNEGIFPDIHRQFKFCLFCATGPRTTLKQSDFAFFLSSTNGLNDDAYHFTLTPEEMELLNPVSRTCPTFRSARDAALAKTIYALMPAWAKQAQTSEWPGIPKTPFNTSNDSALFTTSIKGGEERLLPIYESKFIFQFNHRFATHTSEQPDEVHEVPIGKLLDPNFSIQGRYWLPEKTLRKRFPGRWFFGYRKITNATNARTAVAVVLPDRPCVDSLIIVEKLGAQYACTLLACVNSFCFDYCARQKVAGTNFNHWIWHQLPFPDSEFIEGALPWEGYDESVRAWLLPRVLELSYTAWDLEPFARDCGWDGPPFRWDEERRFRIRCELDAAFFHLYLPAKATGDWRLACKAEGSAYDETPEQLEELKRHFPTPREAVDYIMNTFPIVRRKDEEAYEDYRTKRVILKIYDAMQAAICTGEAYQTLLDPPPGPTLDTGGSFISYGQISDNPPPHIHLPRDATGPLSVGLQLSDLGQRFPDSSFSLRLGVSTDAKKVRVTPSKTSALEAGQIVVLAWSSIELHGSQIPAAMGKIRFQSQTDAISGEAYVSVSIRTDSGIAQTRMSEAEWSNLTSVGIVEELN